MTLTRQQKQIIDAGTLIALDRATDQDKAFLARQMVQTTLPHSDPGNVPVWSRANGPITLIIQQGYDKTGKPYGHPYGIIPRLLMYWMTTEAVRTKNLRIELGDSLAGFMDELGLDSRGKGARSDRVRLQDQMNRLFSSLIRFETSGTSSDGMEYDAQENMLIAEKRVFWWDHRHPEQRTLWDSYVQLDPKFFKAITANPVPVDLRALRAIKRSPLALDLYSLLTYQAFRAGKGGKSRFMSWKQLQSSLGTSYGEPADLRRAVKAALLKIQTVYPELALGERDGGIEVLPESLPAIAAP
jgi:hypothetical protein